MITHLAQSADEIEKLNQFLNNAASCHLLGFPILSERYCVFVPIITVAFIIVIALSIGLLIGMLLFRREIRAFIHNLTKPPK